MLTDIRFPYRKTMLQSFKKPQSRKKINIAIATKPLHKKKWVSWGDLDMPSTLLDYQGNIAIYSANKNIGFKGALKSLS